MWIPVLFEPTDVCRKESSPRTLHCVKRQAVLGHKPTGDK